MKNEKKIAILLATYNGSLYFKEQLDSVISQDSDNWNLFVHDDGSSDSTLTVLDEYNEKYPNRIFIIDDGIKGLRARNNFFHLLESVESEYYMFCDQDDYWYPDMVSTFEHAIEKIDNLNKPFILHSDYSLADSKLNILSESYWKMIKLQPKSVYKAEIICLANPIRGANMLLNECMKQLLFPLEDNLFMYDNWIGYIAAKNSAQIIPIHEATNIYRIHESNCVGSSIGQRKSISEIIKGNIEKCKILQSGGYGSFVKYLYYKSRLIYIKNHYNR